MKKLQLTFLALCISVMAFAQVGIGTNTPTAGSILELKAADKALLLTRVANTAAVTTPVNGMMVYDISTNCIKGFQNGAWTDCLSACGSSNNISNGGDWGLDFTSTVNQIISDGTTAGLISTDKKVFLWGYNAYNEFWTDNPNAISNSISTPIYIPLPNGELAEKLQFTSQSGREAVLVLTSSGKVYVMGLPNYGNIANIIPTAPGTWTQVTLATEPTGFADIAVNATSTYKILLGRSGKIYNGNSLNNPAVQIPFPVGVTAFTKVWANNNDAGAYGVFFKGNNNNIYALDNSGTYIGVGNTTAIVLNSVPKKVLFPSGVNIVDISTSTNNTLALAADGTAYGFGYWRVTAVKYNFAATPLPANVVNDIITKPSPINIPVGSTKFIGVYAGVNQSIVQTDVATYVKGLNSGRIFMNPIAGNNVDAMITYYDEADSANYNLASPALNNFKFFNFADIGSSQAFMFAIGKNNRAYFWGTPNSVGLWGLGGGLGLSGHIVPRPTPIATGIGDPTNPNPLY
jgi:hypothetical protein